MKIRDQEITLPTSMVGNYPNPRWWDAHFARNFSGDQLPPDAFDREALEDVIVALAHDQEMAGLDIISDARCRPMTMPNRPSITTTSAWAMTCEVATSVFPSIAVSMLVR